MLMCSIAAVVWATAGIIQAINGFPTAPICAACSGGFVLLVLVLDKAKNFQERMQK